jgi:large-conductance mechanosensitive channel
MTRDRVLELAIAVALGYALARLATELTEIPVAALAQHVSDDVGDLGLYQVSPYFLTFHLGSTVIAYGPVLASTLALVVAASIAWVVVRRRDRELGVCPFCASRIPYQSTHCAYCGSSVAPGIP